MQRELWRWLHKGSASVVYGVYVCLITVTFLYFIIQNFIVYEKYHETQTALDSLSDGLAIHTVVYMGEYEDEEKYLPTLTRTIYNETGVQLIDVNFDEKTFKKDIIKVSANSVNSDLYNKSFAVSRKASTKFYRYGMAADYISMAIALANDPLANYSMGNRLYIYNNNGTHDMDCSSFVFYALYCSGYLPGESPTAPFTTVSMGGVLRQYGFSRIGSSSDVTLRPGDILIRHENGLSGAEDHTEIYIGNGMNAAAVKIHPNYGYWASVYRLTGY